jgi:hypothetical protein
MNAPEKQHPHEQEPNMVPRSIRVPADLWADAQAAAHDADDNVSRVVRAALQRYVATQRRRAEHGLGKGH